MPPTSRCSGCLQVLAPCLHMDSRTSGLTTTTQATNTAPPHPDRSISNSTTTAEPSTSAIREATSSPPRTTPLPYNDAAMHAPRMADRSGVCVPHPHPQPPTPEAHSPTSSCPCRRSTPTHSSSPHPSPSASTYPRRHTTLHHRLQRTHTHQWQNQHIRLLQRHSNRHLPIPTLSGRIPPKPRTHTILPL